MEIGIVYCFVKSYLAMFEAHVKSFEVINNVVYGIIGWSDEEDIQDFSWRINCNEDDLYDLILLCDYLINNNLIKSDILLKSEEELISLLKLGLSWKKEKVSRLLKNLLDIEMKMIDDGEETDSFFLHF